MADFVKAKDETLEKWRTIRHNAMVLKAEIGSRCGFCLEYRSLEKIFKNETDCPVKNICGQCTPHEDNTIYEGIIEISRNLIIKINDLIEEIKKLEVQT